MRRVLRQFGVSMRSIDVVGERSNCGEDGPARAVGAIGSANVGMSNHNVREKRTPQKSKVSVAMAINHG